MVLSLALRSLAIVGTAWCLAAAEPSLAIATSNPDAQYAPGAAITWTIALKDAEGLPKAKVAYTVKKGGATQVAQGALDLSAGPATVAATLGEPGVLLLEVVAKAEGQKELKGLSLAAVQARAIKPVTPCPADFDAFWQGKLAELAKVPANPRLESKPSERAGVDYWQVTMDNIRGTSIRGQVARPSKPGKLPAMLVVQWAGVYGLDTKWVTGSAGKGWLVLNINAHDLPIDQPAAFYKEQGEGALKGYTAIGNEDRETSYFLRMFLSCVRGVDYLAGREDWDGTTMVVTGNSQGGLQSIVAAGLNPKVTAILANVPAGCDTLAPDGGRASAWPNWYYSTQGKDAAKVRATAPYFDAVNFAARVTCPALIGMGLIDTTSRPDGVFAAINAMKGPVEVVAMPLADHKGKHDAYYQRNGVWQEALRAGKPAPVPAKAASGAQ